MEMQPWINLAAHQPNVCRADISIGLVLLFHLFSASPLTVPFDYEGGNEAFRRLAFRY
jgi:hypothetical protein